MMKTAARSQSRTKQQQQQLFKPAGRTLLVLRQTAAVVKTGKSWAVGLG
jgi:hypothetical protein